MLGIRAGIHCVLVRIANRGKTLVRMLLQKQSDLGLHCLSLSFWLATSVQNFRTFTINVCNSQVHNSFESFWTSFLIFIKFYRRIWFSQTMIGQDVIM